MAWTKFFGAGIGGVLAGLPGAGVGFVFGTLVDLAERVLRTRLLPDPLGLSVESRADADGIYVHVRSKTPVSDGSVALIHVYEGNGPLVASTSLYADGDDNFVLVTPFSGGSARGFIPFGALEYKAEGILRTRVTVVARPDDSPRVLARRDRHMVFAAPRPWSSSELLRPLLRLCAHVVRADGVVKPEELAALRRIHQDIDISLESLKSDDSSNSETLVAATVGRLPQLRTLDLLRLLVEFAEADGEMDPREIEVVKEVAASLGLVGVRWERVREHIGVRSEPKTGPSISSCYSLLGVSEGSDLAAVRAAYRARVKEYHPDRVATCPIEFRELAHRRFVALGEALRTIEAARLTMGRARPMGE